MNRIKDAKNVEIKEIANDLDAITKIDVISQSEGGKALVNSLLSDVIRCVDTLATTHATLTMQQFVSLSADMKSKLDLARVLTRSGKNKKFLEDLLEEALAKETE